MNAVHPFREGNGRTQREFVRQLGLNAGFRVEWRRITREEMTAASQSSFKDGDDFSMRALVRKALG